MSLSKLETQVLSLLQESQPSALKVDQIAQKLNYKGTKNYKKLIKALAFLERIGEISLTAEGKFELVKNLEAIEGNYRANDKGYGFISYEGGKSDLFVPRGKNKGAMDGDRVRVKILRQVDPVTGKGSEAEVIEIVERKANQLVGEFFAYNQEERAKSGFLGYVVPQGEFNDQVKIFIEEGGIHPANHMICIVKITKYPTPERPNDMTGMVSKEIGHKDAPGVDILAILFQFGIPHEFSEAVMKEAEAVSQTIDPSEIKNRRDLRDRLIITIDGADAKDLDDAISLDKLDDNTYQLGVHIADVSHYVRPGSAIDREAYERGTSVYLTDRVVPMLPQRLSNGICSLNPHEDRLALSCEMVINSQGKVLKHDIFKSVIHSSYRMTYKDVNAILDGDPQLRQEYQEIVPMLEDMASLHEILYQMRRRRGALDFDAPEAKIIVDPQGKPLDIQLRERQVGERLIESFMLVANETVAKTYLDKQLPFLYRIHEQPDESKMDRFAEFITNFGIILRGDTSTIAPKQLQEALSQVKGKEFELVVSTMMLRSMQQAKYSENPLGHYGLAAEDYTHFTSPIRRYPDLMVHRLISQYLMKIPSGKELDKLEEKLPEIAIHSSQMERRSVEAERETDALKKAEFMEDKVGMVFEGRISSVTSFGIFVSLPNTVEGLVSLDSLKDDYYQFIPQHLMLIGERQHKIYRVGQWIKVELVAVNVAERQINFEIIEAEPITDVDVRQVQKSAQAKKADSKDRSRKSSPAKRRQSSSKKPTNKNFKILSRNKNSKGKSNVRSSRKGR